MEDDSLRSRKKQRTRAQLIEAALELAQEKGFERTTIEQIVARADSSPRTFARYFPTKESVILALVTDLAGVAADEVATVPPDVAPLEALISGHVTMLRKLSAGHGPVRTTEIAALMQVVGQSPNLRQLVGGFDGGPLLDVIRDRVDDDHDARIVVAVGIAVIVAAFVGPTDWLPDQPSDAHRVPAIMADRISAAYQRLARQFPN
ncbi:TetR/AcrR family transcriptional regulator [Mycobacterium sp. MYCO198283]|uniref:TetR/AcrR family transcriptional regulator n=1 Tax=Mycobacterium sp. MYCO198283 TaxID=2883505 RepID=UPI001E4A1D1A|nr:TetR/AcrR family transcriptional regulator [Mycobacterium sp. MYCO198283]MCG5433793.1 TetR/AcrR family transcriptional regulator [Mycobacterium sp. MYCO198283]